MLELTIRLIVSLAIVVGLLLLLARISARRFGSQKGSLVQVVHRQPLSRTSAVSVVSVGSRVLVLGTTEHKINVLAELDPEELESGQDRDAAVLELVGPGAVEQGNALGGDLDDDLDDLDDDLAPAEVAALLGWPEIPADAPGVETDLVTDDPAPSEAGEPGVAAEVATGTAAGVRRAKPAGHRRAGHRATSRATTRAARSTGRRSAQPATRAAQPGTGALGGSVLSPQTWRQAFAAVTRRAS